MRRLFTAEEAAKQGTTREQLRWAVRTGKCVRVVRPVYAEGSEPVSKLDRQRAQVIAAKSAARGALAGVLLDLDSVQLDDRPTRRSTLEPEHQLVVGDIPCADGLTALIDLASILDDLKWEQALESARRKHLVTIEDIEAVLPALALSRTPGLQRIRRVLSLIPPGAPPTESLLETLFVQLGRTIPGLPPPVRQYVVRDKYGEFVARVDLAWPDLGLFIELDGQQHDGQPVYDANRQTRVTAITGWLCGRFTWHEVNFVPVTSARRLFELWAQCLRRPLPA